MGFSDGTLEHIATLSLAERKALGQYMTPSDIADRMASFLDVQEDTVVLDPAVGTGELLLAARRAGAVSTAGYDVDAGMVEAVSGNVLDVDAEVLSMFSNEWRGRAGTIDRIIANPPYFELKRDDPDLDFLKDFETSKEKGRLNIYGLFFEYSLRLLTEHGRMVFLVPPSMNNGAYFKMLRKTILEYGVVEHLEIIRENNKFEDALTSAQIIVIQKTGDGFRKNFKASSKFLFGDADSFIFTDKSSEIREFWKGKKSLSDLGATVKTGSIPWNQYKDDFIKTGGSILLYSKDISEGGTIQLSGKIQEERRRLPEIRGKALTGSVILVNRIVGSLNNPRLRSALYTGEHFYAENHVNVIQHEDQEVLKKIHKAMMEIDAAALGRYLQAITGNTQLSATELLNMVPLRL